MAVPPLDPDAASRLASFGVIPPMRDRGLAAVREAVEATPWPDDVPEMESADCVTGGGVPLRIHRPHNETGAPALVYFHGGGMVMGSNRSFEPLARTLAAGTRAVAVAVDYRLAPEHPAPAQFDDAYAATVWVAEHADELGIDASRLAVVGDSAGGSLAAGVALAARNKHGPEIFAQVLLYPGLDRDMAAQSVLDMPDAPLLTLDDIHYMHDLAGTPHELPAYAADLTRLPQAIIVTAECDPIRDWGERYADRLRDAHVQVTLTRYPGIYHGFLMRPDATARGRLAIAEVCALLRAKFDSPLRFQFPTTGQRRQRGQKTEPQSTQSTRE